MSTTVHEPPAGAIARDAHWQKKMQRLRSRKPLEVTVVLRDEDAARAVAEAHSAVLTAMQTARLRRRAEITAAQGEIDSGELLAIIEQDLLEQPEVVDAQADLDAAEAEQGEADVAFTFRSLPADVWEDLIEKYPPTPAQEKAGQTYNDHRFGPVLLSACAAEPLAEQEAAELLGGEWYDDTADDPREHRWRKETAVLNQGEAALLLTNAINVNQSARASLGKGSRPTPG